MGLQEPDLEIDPATDDNVVDMSQEMCVENLARWPQLLMRTKKKRARLEGMMIKIPATTPTRAIAALTTKLWEEVLNNYDPKKEVRGDYVTRKKIQYAEKMIRNAFVELYRGLELLKTYRSDFPHLLTFLLRCPPDRREKLRLLFYCSLLKIICISYVLH